MVYFCLYGRGSYVVLFWFFFSAFLFCLFVCFCKRGKIFCSAWRVWSKNASYVWGRIDSFIIMSLSDPFLAL